MVGLKERRALEFQKTIESLNNTRANVTLAEAVRQAEESSKNVPPAYFGDKMFFRIAIVGLVLVVLAVVLGSLAVINYGGTTTDGIVAIGATAVGAIVGIFARPEKTEEETT